MSDWVLWLGIAAFAGALAVGIYLTYRGGWPILAFALLGGLAAIFYVAPPIRWAYRGLGETVIALSYGPWMVLGSLYLHTGAVSWGALWASLVPGLLIMALAVVNAIPDYHQDRLVGKRNLVVRLGRRRGVWLYLALAAAGLARRCGRRRRRRVSRSRAWRRCWRCRCSSRARGSRVRTYESPRQFVPAIRAMVGCYLVAVALFGAGILVRLRPTMANRIDSLRAPLFVSWQITRDCDLACLHCCTDSAPGKRLPDELSADEAMQARGRDRPQRGAVRDAVRRRAAGGAAFLPARGSAGRRRGAAQDRDQRPALRCAASPRGSRGCRSARSRSASTATRQEVYERQRPGGSLAKAHAACRAARGRGPAAGDHVRPDPPQPPRSRGGDPPRPRAGRIPLQFRPADAHRHGRPALAKRSRPPAEAWNELRALFTREAARGGHGDLLRAVQPRGRPAQRAWRTRPPRCSCCRTAG